MKIKTFIKIFGLTFLGLILTCGSFKGIQKVSASNEKIADSTISSYLDTRLSNTTYFVIKLNNQKYYDGSGTAANLSVSDSIITSLGIMNDIIIDGKTLTEYSTTIKDFNFVINHYTLGGFCFKVPTIPDVTKVTSFVVKKGAKFPYVNTTSTPVVTDSYYLLKESYPRTAEDIYQEIVDDPANIDCSSLSIAEEDLVIRSIDDSKYGKDDYARFYIRFKNDIYGKEDTASFDTEKLGKFNFFEKIIIDGKALKEYGTLYDNYEFFINKYTRWNTFSFKVKGINDVRSIKTLEILEGCEFPSLTNKTSEKYVLEDTYSYINPDFEFGYGIPDNALSFSLISGTKYKFTIKTTFSGEKISAIDQDYILINGVKCSSISEINPTLTMNSFVYITFEYDSSSDILLNKDHNFYGNKIVLLKGLKITTTEELANSFRICMYEDECFTELYSEDNFYDYENNFLSTITYTPKVDTETRKTNAIISLRFSQAIIGNRLVYAATNEAWKEQNLSDYRDGIFYNKNITYGFMHSGFKSSLLDNLCLNNKSLAEIFAKVSKEETSRAYAIMVQYANERKTQINLEIPNSCEEVDEELLESYNNGTLSISVKAGWKFPTGTMIKNDATYKINKNTNTFVTQNDNEAIVYYNGQKVTNDQTIESETSFLTSNIHITNNTNAYVIETSRNNNDIYVSIKVGDLTLIQFNVHENITETPKFDDKKGCNSSLTTAGIMLAVPSVIGAILLILKRKEEK